jgi:hypothetical protein
MLDAHLSRLLSQFFLHNVTDLGHKTIPQRKNSHSCAIMLLVRKSSKYDALKKAPQKEKTSN